ncbi:MAG: PilZ domain-containing protein [Deltaproteobacteria bacterium]|nr:PilZ domain-containing protein [Deltaproteobacteria bacterium]
MTEQRRIEERIALVSVKVCLNTEDGRILDCELVDVSPSGVRLKLPPGAQRRKGGERVTLQASCLRLGGLFNNKQALIVWTDDEQLGMRLLTPLALPEDELRKLLAAHLPDAQSAQKTLAAFSLADAASI